MLLKNTMDFFLQPKKIFTILFIAIPLYTYAEKTEDIYKTIYVYQNCGQQDIDVTDITLNKRSIELSVGGTETLRATTTPAGAVVTWTSSNTKVATVSAGGKVTAVGAGDAVITATAGAKSATCNVHVTSAADALYDMNIVDYGLFGEFSDPIPGKDMEITMTDGSTYTCELRTITSIFAWDENIQFVDGYGLVGEGWVCCFEDVPFWVIKETGGYVGAGGFIAQTLADGQIEPYYAHVGQLDPESYGKYVQFMYSGNYSGDFDAEYAAMRAKTNGCFVCRNTPLNDGSGYFNAYWNGLYSAHIKTFIFREATDTDDAMFAAEIEWGNLDGNKYLYGFEFDTEKWEKDRKVSLLAPYTSHYNTVTKVYDENGLFTNKAPRRAIGKETTTYHIGDPSKYHKELPQIHREMSPARERKISQQTTMDYRLSVKAENCTNKDTYDIPYNQSVELIAVPNDGYEFTKWSDGNRENPRIITIKKDETLKAYFAEKTEDIDNVYDSPECINGQKVMHNGVLYIERNGKIYNALGGKLR